MAGTEYDSDALRVRVSRHNISGWVGNREYATSEQCVGASDEYSWVALVLPVDNRGSYGSVLQPP